jgi:hypothetical protein
MNQAYQADDIENIEFDCCNYAKGSGNEALIAEYRTLAYYLAIY